MAGSGPAGKNSTASGKLFAALGKILLAGLLAFLILEAFSRLYFNRSLHSPNPSGATDYVWEPGVFYSVWTEGIGYGRTNNQGFYNAYDYREGMPVDVLIMGSSFMQAEQVPQSQSAAVLLDQALGDQTVYNIGVAGHYFLTCVQNVAAAGQSYRPRTIVLETQSVQFSDEELEQVLRGQYPELESVESARLRTLKRSDFLNLLYYQLTYYRNEHGGYLNPPDCKPLFSSRPKVSPEAAPAAPEGAEKPTEAAPSRNEELIRAMLTKLHDDAAASGARVIVVFHPKTWLDGYGGMWVDDAAQTTGFAQLCAECDIALVDMSQRYLTEYEKNRVLPYGFANTEVGQGHLNAEGNRMMAEELQKKLEEIEG